VNVLAKPERRSVTMGNVSDRRVDRGDDSYETPPPAIESLLTVEELPARLLGAIRRP
jgi:hypothetical protein